MTKQIKVMSASMTAGKSRFMFAVVTEDKSGQTIQLFKTIQQAEEFYAAIQ